VPLVCIHLTAALPNEGASHMPLATGQQWFTDDQYTSLGWLRAICEANRSSIVDELSPLLFQRLGSGPPEELRARDHASAEQLWQDVLKALHNDTRALAARLSAYGSYSACAGTDLRSLTELIAEVRKHIVHLLVAGYADTPDKLEGSLAVMQRFFDRTLAAITREYLLYREALMEQQRCNEEAERIRMLELEAENIRIQAASRLKSEFLANMSHELRTPLNSIIGFADLLYDREIAPDSPQHAEFLGDILKSARHLLKLINDVLDLAKVEAGKMEFRPEQTDLSILVGEVSDVLHSQAIRNEVKLTQEILGGLECVLADPARLRQVLYNFLSNAIKFTPPGGRVTIRAFPVGDSGFRIEVEDTGVGIAPENLARLFVEFEQLERRVGEKLVGTGLGLALTKRIVEAQGGEVGVRSVLGQGSTFWVALPAELDCVRPSPPTSYFEELRPSRRPKKSQENGA
jgi:signal transduction histidine kinase